MKNIEKVLKNRFLVKEINPDLSFVKKRKSIKILYGETFDLFGMTIDSLKYYFFLSLVHRYLEQTGAKVTSIVLVGDRAALMNDSAIEKNKLVVEGQKRVEFIKKIIQVYSLPVKPLLMSEMLKENKIPALIGTVEKYISTSDEAKKLLKKTVLTNRIKQEIKSGFLYSKEEIAIGTLFDIKIGPPREKNYDEVTRMIQRGNDINQLLSIYLQPSYPLGKDFSFFLSHPEIEEFGLTPYKAGSNKLQEFRIILGNTSYDDACQLISNSFESLETNIVHPVFDILVITDLARKFIENDFSEFASYKFEDISNLKGITQKQLEKYIYLPLSL